jgi:Ca2+-binding EF-hand superfamily protein
MIIKSEDGKIYATENFITLDDVKHHIKDCGFEVTEENIQKVFKAIEETFIEPDEEWKRDTTVDSVFRALCE